MGNSPETCRRHYSSLTSEAMVDEVDFLKAPNYAAATA